MIRVHRSVAGREVLSAVERLMDGLLVEEARAAAAVTREMHGLTAVLEARVLAVARRDGRSGVVRSGVGLLPGWATVRTMIEPPLGVLLARTRERAWRPRVVSSGRARRRLGRSWPGLAKRAALAASAVAPDVERDWMDRTLDAAARQWQVVVAEAGVQHQYWAARNEPKEFLVARWCSPELTRLPGSGRGALWGFVPAVVELARRGSVATVSGLLMAGYEGWNRAVDVAEVL